MVSYTAWCFTVHLSWFVQAPVIYTKLYICTSSEISLYPHQSIMIYTPWAWLSTINKKCPKNMQYNNSFMTKTHIFHVLFKALALIQVKILYTWWLIEKSSMWNPRWSPFNIAFIHMDIILNISVICQFKAKIVYITCVEIT